jgi:ADP-heptose:LPS heptosyltransferase
VETDGRPNSALGALRLAARLRRERFSLVYDLQGNDRTNLLFQLLRPVPPRWSGVAFGCALPHRNPGRMNMHTLERQAEQLRDAGIWPEAPAAAGSAPAPDVSWMLALPAGPPPELVLDRRPLVLLAPGAAARRPAKLWPCGHYAELAGALTDRGFTVGLIGGPAEAGLGAQITARAPRAIDLIGRTDLPTVARLGARAQLAVGNDTGPVHLIAAAGAPTVVLFSADSDPALCAPRGRVAILRQSDLADLAVETVLATALGLAREHPRSSAL